MTRKVVRKSASKKPPKSVSGQRRHPDALDSPEANDEAIENPKYPNKAEKVAKVVQLIVSVGDDDRGRDFEEFVDDIKKSLGAIEPPFTDKNGKRKPGPHVATTGGHYVLDGKVCLPDDYDKKNKGFKKGAVPPTWAGGPKIKPSTPGLQQRQMDWDLENLPDEEYDKKYRLGKYEPKGETPQEHDARMRRQRAKYKEEQQRQEDEALEEFEWDESDIDDDEKMSEVVDASASRAVKRMKKKSTPKKVVRRRK